MGNKKKIVLFVGARPNFIKAAPLYSELKRKKEFTVHLIHTGQHSDPLMSDKIFSDLGLAKPDFFLNVISGKHTSKLKRISDIRRLYVAIKKNLTKEQPDLVIVFGDVFSTLVAAWAAKHLDLSVAHVEAGLRSHDISMPEEISRILVDRISDYLFTPSVDADTNLNRAGINSKKIFMVGNIMIDTLAKNKAKAQAMQSYRKYRLPKKEYAYITLHRQSNVDNRRVLTGITNALIEIAANTKIFFPVHPRTHDKLQRFGLLQKLENSPNIIIAKPIGYLENISLQATAKAVLTDSGGIQEETSYLGVPCLTIRKNTERPITIVEGTNKLVGIKPEGIVGAFRSISNSNSKFKEIKYWDGQTAKRITKYLHLVDF